MLRYLYFTAGAALALASCQKIEKVGAPNDFDVTLEQQTYVAGDTVRFSLHGNPDIISVYTGELGCNYNYIGGRVAEPKFFFTFDEQNIDGQQLDQLQVYVSYNFNEDYTYEGITAESVEWINISNRFSLVGPYKDANKVVIGTTAFANVGKGELTDLLTDDRTKLYFAFHYRTDPIPPGKDSHITRTKNIVLSSQYETLSTQLATWSSFGWKMATKFAQQASRPSEVQENNKQIQFRIGWGNKPEGGTYQGDGADNWAVSGPIYLDRKLDMGPDRAIGIKGVNDIKKLSYEKVYQHPGTYEVVFKAQNANIESAESKLVRMTITIEDKDK